MVIFINYSIDNRIMSSRRKCRFLSKKCNTYSVKELDEILRSCTGSRMLKKDLKKIISRKKRISKQDYCRLIKTSTMYKEPGTITKAQFKKQAKLASRHTYNLRSNILGPLTRPVMAKVYKPLASYGLMRILSLASDFKSNACFYYPPVFSNKFGIKYIVKNTFDPDEIDRANTPEKEKKLRPIDNKINVIFPPTLWDSFNKCKKRFFVCFIRISVNRVNGGDPNYMSQHSNVLIYDRMNNEVERFEPLSLAVYTKYEYAILDEILTEKFNELGVTYVAPIDWEPAQGLQKQEIIQSEALDIEDPAKWSSGFCLVWTYIWTYLRLNNPSLDRDQLFHRIVSAFRNTRTSMISFAASLMGYLNTKHENIIIDMGWEPDTESLEEWSKENYPKLLKYYKI